MDHTKRLTRSIARIAAGPAKAPLAELASEAELSPFHFQRTFRAWVGLPPGQVAAYAVVAKAKGPLRAAENVLDVSLDLGLSGPSRLHDRFVAIEAMTPGEWAAEGLGLRIGWGRGPTPLGEALVAWTARGACRLHFLDQDEPEALLRGEYPQAELMRDDAQARSLLATAFQRTAPDAPLPVVVRGTRFQIAVWRALLERPTGSLTSYGTLARDLGHPSASRAVGTAVGANPLAVLIPCHRVITSSGLLGGYRWGLDRKCALLAREASAQSSLRRAK